MKVTIDPHSGFCFGVVYAIQMAEDELGCKRKIVLPWGYCTQQYGSRSTALKRTGNNQP